MGLLLLLLLQEMALRGQMDALVGGQNQILMDPETPRLSATRLLSAIDLPNATDRVQMRGHILSPQAALPASARRVVRLSLDSSCEL